MKNILDPLYVLEHEKMDRLEKEFSWKEKHFKEAKEDDLMFEEDVLHLKEGETYRITSFNVSGMNRYIRRGEWCYCMEIHRGDIFAIKKNKLYSPNIQRRPMQEKKIITEEEIERRRNDPINQRYGNVGTPECQHLIYGCCEEGIRLQKLEGSRSRSIEKRYKTISFMCKIAMTIGGILVIIGILLMLI